MNGREEAILNVIEAHASVVDWIQANGLDYSDFSPEEIAGHVMATAPLAPIQRALVELCEDNEVMREVINDYFTAPGSVKIVERL